MKKVFPLERFWVKSEYHREKIKAVSDKNLKISFIKLNHELCQNKNKRKCQFLYLILRYELIRLEIDKVLC